MEKVRFIGCLAITLLLFADCQTSQNEDRIKPAYRDISEFVYASATVVSEGTYQCRPSRTGIIKDVFVEKGARVVKDQLLFTISPTADLNNRLTNAEINLRDAKENLLGSNSRLKGIEIELDRIKSQNLVDSSNHERKRRLWDQGIGSKSELEQSLLKYQNSTGLIESLKLEYRQTKTSLLNKYEIAQNQVTTERDLLGDLEIRSEVAGIVFNIFKESGELITPQEKFAEIGSNENYTILLNIDEVDISKIELGDTAIIQLEAYSDKIYTSILSAISESKDEATQTFEVEAIFIDTPRKLYHGLSGEANILVARRKDALVVPADYILESNSVMTEDGIIEVRIGVRTIEHVEILEGIDSSSVLMKPETK